MSHAYVTSDWHFGHKNVTRFRNQFESMEAMEDHIMDRCLEVVTKRDVLYCLGDMAFDRRGLLKLHDLPCRLILIRGNHDTLQTMDYLTVFEAIHGALEYKGCWMTHIPIHPMELYRRSNIHGHCHSGGPRELQNCPEWGQYFNAILEFNDYAPVKLTDVKQVISTPDDREQERE